MGFEPISIDKYVKKYLKNNPSENEKNLQNRLNFKQQIKIIFHVK